MTGIFDLEEKDKIIMEILSKTPDITQREISKIVGLSQPSVGARIKKLRKYGIISHTYGINIKDRGLYIFKVDIKCKRPSKIIEIFKECPYFLNGFIVAGNINLTLMFIDRDISTLESIVDKHIRSRDDVFNVDVGLIVRGEKDTVIPFKINVNHSKEAPCKCSCKECDYYKNELCFGCPVTGHYKGNIWK